MIIDYGDGHHDYRVSFIVLVLQHVIPDQGLVGMLLESRSHNTVYSP